MQQQNQELDQRVAVLQRLFELSSEATRHDFNERMEVSWIHHDSALEGVVYSRDELVAALRGEPAPEATSVQTFDELRQNKTAIDLVRRIAIDRKAIIDADTVRDIYACLAPDEVDGKKPPAYRKDIPLHRLYFHEIAAPDKIAPLLKEFGKWLNSPEARRTTHVVRLAAKAHFHLMQIYPYPKHSGKVARLVMNLLLLQGGFPPAIIHSTDRQRYYDALKTNENALALLVKEAIQASVESGIRFLEANAPPPPPSPPKRSSKGSKAKGPGGRGEGGSPREGGGPRGVEGSLRDDEGELPVARTTERVPPRPHLPRLADAPRPPSRAELRMEPRLAEESPKAARPAERREALRETAQLEKPKRPAAPTAGEQPVKITKATKAEAPKAAKVVAKKAPPKKVEKAAKPVKRAKAAAKPVAKKPVARSKAKPAAKPAAKVATKAKKTRRAA